jgi:hypothetical protein
MYTCDECCKDVGLSENLIRVWYESGMMMEIAILVCYDCLKLDSECGEFYTLAEGDPHWEYLAGRIMK